LEDDTYHRDESLFDLEKAINEITELNMDEIPASKLPEVYQRPVRPTEVFRAASLTKSQMLGPTLQEELGDVPGGGTAFITEFPVAPKRLLDPDSYPGTVETLINA
jgi:hypothetical protein